MIDRSVIEHSVAGTSQAATLARILVVDDDESIRVAMARYLRRAGYDVELAANGDDAWARLTGARWDAMICDVRMPGLDGPELLVRALAHDRTLAVVMLTAVNDAPTAADLLGRGASDYLVKPVELRALQDSLLRALDRRALRLEKERVDSRIREEVELRTAELEVEKEALRDLSVNVVETLVNAMEAKDMYLRGHSQRVADLAGELALELGLDDDTADRIRLAGKLHDVGKIGIREEILNKPAALTPVEFDHVKEHVRIGIEILRPLRSLGEALDFIHDHHEHWDGSGYPRGRNGTAITLGGRVLAGADAFDALTSKRAYRDPMRPDETLAYLASLGGSLLDPDVVQALQAVIGRRSGVPV